MLILHANANLCANLTRLHPTWLIIKMDSEGGPCSSGGRSFVIKRCVLVSHGRELPTLGPTENPTVSRDTVSVRKVAKYALPGKETETGSRERPA